MILRRKNSVTFQLNHNDDDDDDDDNNNNNSDDELDPEDNNNNDFQLSPFTGKQIFQILRTSDVVMNAGF